MVFLILYHYFLIWLLIGPILIGDGHVLRVMRAAHAHEHATYVSGNSHSSTWRSAVPFLSSMVRRHLPCIGARKHRIPICRASAGAREANEGWRMRGHLQFFEDSNSLKTKL